MMLIWIVFGRLRELTRNELLLVSTTFCGTPYTCNVGSQGRYFMCDHHL